jgi:SPOR domain
VPMQVAAVAPPPPVAAPVPAPVAVPVAAPVYTPPPAPIPAPQVVVAKPAPVPVPQVVAYKPAPAIVQTPKPVQPEKTVSTEKTVTKTVTAKPVAVSQATPPAAPAVVAQSSPTPAPVSHAAPAVPSPEKVAAIVPVTVPAPSPAPDVKPESAPAPVQTSLPATDTAAANNAAVQIAALNSEDAAHKEWSKVSSASPALFAGKSPDISKVQVGGQTYYRLRVNGFASNEDATHFCSEITAAHGTCMPANF